MLARLATVAFDAGLPDSRRRLLDALREVRDRESRVDVLTRLAALTSSTPATPASRSSSSTSWPARRDPDARLAVEAAALDALMMIPDRHAERARRLAAIEVARRPTRCCARVVLAHRAWIGAELGTPDAATARRWRCEAIDGGVLLARGLAALGATTCACARW